MKKRRIKALIASVLVFAQLMSGVSVLAEESSDNTVAEITVSGETTEEAEEKTEEVKESAEAVGDEVKEDEDSSKEVADEDSESEIVDKDANSGDDNSNSPAEDQKSDTEDAEEVEEVAEYTVTFMDSITDSVIKEVTVEENGTVEYPDAPEHDGYVFVEWDVELAEIIEDVVVTALYEEVEAKEEEEEEIKFPAFKMTVGGITFTADEGVIPEGAKFEVVKVRDTAEIEELIDEDIIYIDSYDITLYDAEGEKIQPNGDVSLTFDVDEEEAENFKVFYTDGSSAEELNAELNSGSVTFKTNHFSTYSVVGVSENGIMTLADVYPSFSKSYSVMDGMATFYISADAGVIPSGAYFEFIPLEDKDYESLIKSTDNIYDYFDIIKEFTFTLKLHHKEGYEIDPLGNFKIKVSSSKFKADHLAIYSIKDDISKIYDIQEEGAKSTHDYLSFTELGNYSVVLANNIGSDYVYVTFETFTDEEIPMQVVKFGDYVKKPEKDPEKENYKFLRWGFLRTNSANIINSSDETSFDFNKVITKPSGTTYTHFLYGYKLRLVAVWTGIMILDADNDTQPQEVEISKGKILSNYTKVDLKPVKEGYTFTGWYLPDSDVPINVDVYIPYEPVTLTAHWIKDDENTHKVSFETYNGSRLESIDIPDGSKIPKQAEPVYVGHKLVGWYEDENFIKKWDFTNGVVTKDITLYAKYEEAYVTVNFVTYDKEIEIQAQVIPRWGKATKPTKDKNGIDVSAYEWVPYYKDYSLNSSSTFDVFTDYIYHITYDNSALFQASIYEDITFYQKEEKGTYTITFDTRGGNYIEPRQANSATGLPIAVKDGYTFLGWFVDKECTKPFNVEAIYNDITLYAGWTQQTHTVIIKLNGGDATIRASSLTSDTYTVTDDVKLIVGHNAYLYRGDIYSYDYKESKFEVTPDNKLIIYSNCTPDFNKYGSYTFGLYKDEECTQSWIYEKDTVTSDMTLYVGYYEDATTAKTSFLAPNNNYIVIRIFDETGILVHQYAYKMFSSLDLSSYFRFIFPDIIPISTSDFKNYDNHTERHIITRANPNGELIIMSDMYKDIHYYYVDYIMHTNGVVYTVDFDSDGGNNVPKQFVVKNNSAKEPEPPTKEGCGFKYWSKDKYTKYDFTEKINSDIILYAVYASGYIVKFDAMGGTPEPDDQEIELGGKITQPRTPSKNGYYFMGWFTDNVTYAKEWQFGTDVVEDNMTLYAKWDKETYKVTFDAKGGSPTPQQQTVEYGGKVTKPATEPTRSGYSFKGWYTSETYTTAWNFEEDTVEDNMTLYARWTKANKVSFEVNGGTPKPADQNIETGEKVEKPAEEPTKKGHTFRGWYKDRDCTDEWDFDEDTVKDDMTLYAKWEVNTYDVNFDAKGGNPTPSKQEVKYMEKATKPETDPTKEKHAFKGWFTSDSYTKEWNFTVDVVEDDMTLYAKWVEAFKVSFDVNGGDGKPDDQMIEDGDKAEEPNKKPTKRGHRFGGWYKDTDFEDEWDFDEDVVEEDTELHAKWIPEIYDVTFDAKGGSPTPSTQHVEYNNKATEPETAPTKQGYNFKGWFTDDVTYVKEWQFDTDVVENNITLYARWTKMNKVTFDTDGGDPKPEDQEVETGEKVDEPDQEPTKKGHKFRGWYKDKEGTEPWDFDEDEVEDDTTIYAKWEVEVYEVTFNAMGGSPTPKKQDVEYNNLVQKPTAPSKTKSVLVGWYKEQQCLNEWNFATDHVEEDMTLYAKWDTVDYVVTFNANLGTPTPDPQGLHEGEKATQPKNVKRDSVDSTWLQYASASGKYCFDWNLWDTSRTSPRNSPLWDVVARVDFDLKGWTEDSGIYKDGLYYNIDGVELYNFSEVVNHDMTLYAVWKPVGTYLFSYDVLIVDENNNIIKQDTIFSQLVKEGDKVSISVNLGKYGDRNRYSVVREYIGEPFQIGSERANWGTGKAAGTGGIYSVIYDGSDIKHCTVDLSEPFNQRNYCMYIMVKDKGVTDTPTTNPDPDPDPEPGDDTDPEQDPDPEPDPDPDPTPLPTIIPLVIPDPTPDPDPTPSLITKLIPTPEEESAETDDDWILHLPDITGEDSGERLYTYVRTTQWGYVTESHALMRDILVHILDYEPPVVYYREEEDAIVPKEEDLI